MPFTSRIRHPWWREVALDSVRVRRDRRLQRAMRIAAGLVGVAVVLPIVTGARPILRAGVHEMRLGMATHAALIAMVVGLAAFVASRRFAHAHAERLQTGWWRAAPVDRGSIDRVLLIVPLMAGCASISVLTVGLTCLALLTGGSVAIASLAPHAFAILAGCLLGAASTVWRRHHPPSTPRSGVRVPLLRIRTPLPSPAPHLFDWQRREAVLRWRRGGNVKLIGLVMALTPGASHPLHVMGALILVTTAAWLGTVLEASGDVATQARRCVQATPIDNTALRRASLRYPLLSLAGAGMLFACGTLLSGGVGPLPVLWAAVGCALSARGVIRLVRLPAVRRAP